MTYIICKNLWVPGCAQSFHQFSKDPQGRQKWMKLIGLSKVTKNSIVYSDHFTPESYYHQTDGYTKLKRLLSTAEPIIKKNNKVLTDIINQINTTNNNDCSCSERMEDVDSNKELKKIVNNSILIKSINKAKTNSDNTSINVNDKGILSVSLKFILSPSNSVANDVVTSSKISVNNFCNVKAPVNKNEIQSNLKRESLDNNQEHYPKKKFCFMDRYTVKTIKREDFTTDLGWNNFKRYVTIQRKKNGVNRR